MEKEFVPYELALRMKQLGFNEPCFATYDEDIELELQDFEQTYDTFPSHIIAVPLYQQAFRWFRDKHGLDSAILPTGSTPYQFRLYHKSQDITKAQIYDDYMGKEYKTYEEAELACLEKLIEIEEQSKTN